MKKLLFPVLIVAAFLTACVPSLQPLYTPETTIFREELIGVWKEKPEENGETWTFTKGENNTYQLNIRDEEKTSVLEVRLVKLGDHLFLDLFPSEGAIEDTSLGDFYRASLVPAHLIIKLKLGAKLELQLLQTEKLDELLKAAPKTLAHTHIEKDRLVITASTQELQAFIKKHAESAELWGDSGVMQKLVL